MNVTVEGFCDNESIPVKYTGFGEDVSPEFKISDVPDETVSFAVVLDDLDVPFVERFSHWIIWNIPRTEVIPGGLPEGDVISEPVCACQGKAWGKNRYRGPKPPFFIRGEHRYVFTFYALDCMVDIPTGSDRKALLDAMRGHVSAAAEVTGRFGRGSMKTMKRIIISILAAVLVFSLFIYCSPTRAIKAEALKQGCEWQEVISAEFEKKM